MKFTDLNFDCLETVLEYLELIDLLNVADSTKRLNKAAELVFAREYGKKEVRIRIIRISHNLSSEITDGRILIIDLKIALQLLRCFGPVISRINFIEWFPESVCKISQILIAYINKYCADYLKEFYTGQTGYERYDSLEYFDRPFPKLTKLGSSDLIFSENSCLNRLFPKMRCLHIWHMSNNSFFNINTKHFPYLEELLICEDFDRSKSFLNNEMVINLLLLNPQLKNLTIKSTGPNLILNTDLIRSAVDSLQNIENLKLNLKPITFLDNSDNIIRMKSVKLFDIYLPYADVSSYFPFEFENLKTFCTDFPKAQYVNGSDQFFNFIDKHSSITNLTICNIESFDVVDWSRLAKYLPLLLEIEIIGCFISADEAIKIMDKFQMLKKFHFKLTDDYDNFRKHLNKNWYRTYETELNYVKLHRKM